MLEMAAAFAVLAAVVALQIYAIACEAALDRLAGPAPEEPTRGDGGGLRRSPRDASGLRREAGMAGPPALPVAVPPRRADAGPYR